MTDDDLNDATGGEDEEDFVLADLADDELVEQMHDDLYDGLADEIDEGTRILLDRGWSASRVLNDALVEAMMPHLWVVNLNGMRPEGPKILPFGAGTHEREMLQRVLDAGFTGPFGVLGHVDDADVKVILEGNLRGLGLR